MKATFENSVSVLVRAYMNGTLAHSACSACAVGNLVAAAIGTEPQRGSYGTLSKNGRTMERSEDEEQRAFVFADGRRPRWAGAVLGRVPIDRLAPPVQDEIEATGYRVLELHRIERAFESAPIGKDSDTWMFNGLLAVVDVLAEIHGVDLSTKESAVGQFKEVHPSKQLA